MTELPQPPRRPSVERRAGRPRALDRDAVVSAALRVLDAEGLDAVTIRRVAEELGTSGTALYTYVRDKDDLVDLLLDRVLGETDLSSISPTLPWQEQVREIGREMRRVLGAHRDVARATLGRVPQGENALVLIDEMLGRLRTAGVPDDVIALGVDLLSLYVGALTFEESIGFAAGFDDPEAIQRFVGEMRAYFERLPRDRFPNLVAMAVPLTSDADRFEFGLDVLVRGLVSRANDS
ncbi:MAG TPA: TetR/AcrR family transcriptional regulator [Gaiellaceae bacterium]|jgi:AcrR family transcriptional regulator